MRKLSATVSLSVLLFLCCGAMAQSNIPELPVKRKAYIISVFWFQLGNHGVEEFEDVMNEYLSDGDKCCAAQIKDIYQLGWFLHHNKYRWVRYSYVSILAGLGASSVMAIVLTILQG